MSFIYPYTWMQVTHNKFCGNFHDFRKIGMKFHLNPLPADWEDSQEMLSLIWASSRDNLSSGFPTKRVSKQSPHLQSLAI